MGISLMMAMIESDRSRETAFGQNLAFEGRLEISGDLLVYFEGSLVFGAWLGVKKYDSPP
jgi:hypothetical protein